MKHFFKKMGVLNFLFLLLAISAVIWAFLLQRVAFPEAGTADQQISATVYVKTLPAHVNLQSEYSPGDSMDFTLSVTVTGPAKRPDPWLLVVQCSSEPGQPKQPSATLWSESAAGQQSVGSVLATSQTKARWTGTFACYTGLSGHGQTASAVIKGQDINLSCPPLNKTWADNRHWRPRPCTPKVPVPQAM